jgi:hypothetical protein
MMDAPPEPPQSSGRRRLKGLLALLPETGTLYPSHRVPPNHHHHHHLIDGAATESIGNNHHNGATKTVTSRKQQRRLLKRLRQEETITQQMNGTLDLEDGGGGGGSREKNSQDKETIYLSEYLRNEVDVVALFVFDPYQPYSLQLLQKLIDVGRHDNSDPSTEATLPATVPFDMLEAVVAEQDSTITNEPPSPAALAATLDTNREQGDEPDTTASIAPAISSKLHCFVVTSCNDMALIDRLLYNSGTVLLPWTDDTYHWRLATGIHSCPAVVSVIECRTGRNLFPIQQEELALDWNTSSHIRTAWLHERKSAFTILQRIQAYALYPTASVCNIQ